MEIVIVVVLLGVGIAIAWRMRGALEGTPRQVTRAIERVAPTPLAGVEAGGRHRIDGVARPVDQPFPSPATGQPCLAYDVWISAFPGDSPSRRSAQGAEDFLLDDGTAVALVRVDGAAISIERRHEAPRTTLDQVPFADQVLRSQGVSIGSQATCRLEMREGIIGPGDPVAVVGQVDPADDDARRLGADYVVRAAPGTPLLIGSP